MKRHYNYIALLYIISISLSLISCSTHRQQQTIEYKPLPTVFSHELHRGKDGLFYTKEGNIPYTGFVITQYPSGKRKSKGSVRNGLMVDEYTEYFENGQVKVKGEYRNGVQEGTWITNHDTGAVALKGQFSHGLLQGTWYVYGNGGILAKKMIYQNGVLIKTLRYNVYKEKVKENTKTIQRRQELGDVHLGPVKTQQQNAM